MSYVPRTEFSLPAVRNSSVSRCTLYDSQMAARTHDRILAQEMEHPAVGWSAATADEDVAVLFADCERHGADDRAEERELCHEEDEAYCGLSVGARGGERRRTGVVELRG